jgi:radical SAM superfamily enzyme
MRFTCDTPKDRLAFPRGVPEKGQFLDALRAELEARDTRQGRLYGGR